MLFSDNVILSYIFFLSSLFFISCSWAILKLDWLVWGGFLFCFFSLLKGLQLTSQKKQKKNVLKLHSDEFLFYFICRLCFTENLILTLYNKSHWQNSLLSCKNSTWVFTFTKLNLSVTTPLLPPFQHFLAHKLFACVHCFQTHCTEYPSANTDGRMTLQSHSANPYLVAHHATQHAFDKWQHARRGQFQHRCWAVQNVHSLTAWRLHLDLKKKKKTGMHFSVSDAKFD